jgi:hypothetical protein
MICPYCHKRPLKKNRKTCYNFLCQFKHHKTSMRLWWIEKGKIYNGKRKDYISDKHKQLRKENRHWDQLNPNKIKAHRILYKALKKGKLIKPDICFKCGNKNNPIEAHHENYGNPLEVIWLCKSCHKITHSL